MGMKWALIAALLLAGCGYKGQMSRIDSKGLSSEELRQARAAEKADIDQALAPSPEYRPVRVDDVTIRLEERADDPFNLPPDR